MRYDRIKNYSDAVRGKAEAKYMCSGRTTRYVDEYVQELFNAKIGEWVNTYDHSLLRTGHEGLFHKLCKRMEIEHGIQLESKRLGDGRYAVRIPESIMVDMANRRTIWIEDAERMYHELTGK